MDRERNVLEFRFAFFAQDFEASVRFYRDALGMQVLSSWDRLDGKGALLDAGGAAVIEIYGAANGKNYLGPAPTAINLALRLENELAVDICYQQLLAKAIVLQSAPEDRPWGHRSFVVIDPDGIPIHYYCELG
jgi:catechol 2,3-dioxygenase-like lactoylglutathione lyase family enzyme